VQIKLHICLGWQARLLSGTSELVLWVQLPSFQGGDHLVSKAIDLQDEVTEVGSHHMCTSREGDGGFFACGITSTAPA